MYQRGEDNKNSKVEAGHELLYATFHKLSMVNLFVWLSYELMAWVKKLLVTTKLDNGEHQAIHNENTFKTLNPKLLKFYENSWHEP